MSANAAKCAEKLQEHESLFQGLWRNFVRLLGECGPIPLVIEWPRSCAYWNRQEVHYRRVSDRLHFANFEGCMFGTRMSDGVPLGKMWRFATNIPVIFAMFHTLCDGSHSHAEARGKDLLNTQYYTPQIAGLVHTCLTYFFSRLSMYPGDDGSHHYDGWHARVRMLSAAHPVTSGYHKG